MKYVIIAGFFLVGNRREKVQIKDIRVHILDRKPIPKEGTLLSIPHEGSRKTEKTEVNLAGADKTLKITDSGRPLLDEKTIDLSELEPIGIEIQAFSPNDWYKWELEIEIAYGDKKEIVTTRSDGTANGPPFQAIGDPSVARGTDTRFTQDYLASSIFEPFQVINCADVRRGVPSEVNRAKQANPRADPC